MEKTQENRVVETGQSSTKDSHFFFGVRLLIIVVDIIMLINLLVDVNISCGGYLRAVLLNSKTFKGKQRSNKIFIKNEHVLFFSEVVLMLICFLWTFFGTIQINKSGVIFYCSFEIGKNIIITCVFYFFEMFKYWRNEDKILRNKNIDKYDVNIYTIRKKRKVNLKHIIWE
ncbi:hypothetical protein PFLG_01627 [Plasmodium falciparum RAJ116]|uniref:Uncharacterized protein n=1 Tax=Plasmodium falciparum RAJ116 TaxID=580058 RepID=A0A0L0CV48_PLAFA|nr:hypothetical protein PFLG_01627 [Plasmodium falciparum RAJ116]